MQLERNVGTVDRSVRAGLAVLLAVVALVKARKGWKAVLLGVASLVGLTAATGSCPAYSFADFDTMPYKSPTLEMGSCGGENGCEGCTCSN